LRRTGGSGSPFRTEATAAGCFDDEDVADAHRNLSGRPQGFGLSIYPFNPVVPDRPVLAAGQAERCRASVVGKYGRGQRFQEPNPSDRTITAPVGTVTA
jgi:hypothetical protein